MQTGNTAMPVCLLLLWIGLALGAWASVLRVPFPFGQIQWAIDASQAGDTVLVERGVYRERLTIPVHDLTLASRCLFTGDTLDIAGTIIDGELEGTVITVLAGERLFRLNGFVITRGWAVFDTTVTGGGVWVQERVDIQFENLVFTNNGTEFGAFGAAVCGGFPFNEIGSAKIHNLQITDNNHLPGMHWEPDNYAFALRGTGRFEVSNIFCNGAGLNDPAFFVASNDSLFADSIRVVGYVGNFASVCGLRSSVHLDVEHVRILDTFVGECGSGLIRN
jgi:hypothetical protein